MLELWAQFAIWPRKLFIFAAQSSEHAVQQLQWCKKNKKKRALVSKADDRWRHRICAHIFRVIDSIRHRRLLKYYYLSNRYIILVGNRFFIYFIHLIISLVKLNVLYIYTIMLYFCILLILLLLLILMFNFGIRHLVLEYICQP